MSRYRRVKLIGLIVLAFIAGLAVLTIRETRQAQRDQDLIAAIRKADAAAVATLLERGANPNARESPQAVGPFWRRLLEMLRPTKQSMNATRSAMQLAIYRDVYGPTPTDAIIAALKRHGAIDVADPRAAAPSLAWAGRLLAHSASPPPTDDYSFRYDVTDALEAYSGILVKYGPSAAAYLGRARCRLRLGNYSVAVNDLRLTTLWSPADTNSRNLLAEAEKRVEVSTFTRPRESTIDNRDSVMYVNRFSIPGQGNLWAVIQGNAEAPYCSDIHLAIYAERGRNDYRLLWRSKRLIDTQFTENGKNDEEFWDVHLSVCRLTCGKTPEVVVQEMSPGGSWSPSHMDIFAWHNGRMQRILDVSSSQRLWFEDLRHDGAYQVRNAYEIGRYMGHGAQPRWSDVYAYKNGRYVLADRDFPSAFAQWPALLRQVLQRHPGDPEILKYLAEATAILNHRATATVYAGRTTSRFAPLLPSNDSDE